MSLARAMCVLAVLVIFGSSHMGHADTGLQNCEGKWIATFTPPDKLTCDRQCTEGCVLGAVQTALGSGRACMCDIVGPPANCCRLAWLPFLQKYTWSGVCGAPGCASQSTGACKLIYGINNDDEIVLIEAACLGQQ